MTDGLLKKLSENYISFEDKYLKYQAFKRKSIVFCERLVKFKISKMCSLQKNNYLSLVIICMTTTVYRYS